jgi:hypothetical protein
MLQSSPEIDLGRPEEWYKPEDSYFHPEKWDDLSP